MLLCGRRRLPLLKRQFCADSFLPLLFSGASLNLLLQTGVGRRQLVCRLFRPLLRCRKICFGYAAALLGRSRRELLTCQVLDPRRSGNFDLDSDRLGAQAFRLRVDLRQLRQNVGAVSQFCPQDNGICHFFTACT